MSCERDTARRKDADNFTYSGKENLDVMQAAANYNAHLIAKVKKSLGERLRIIDFGAGDGDFARKIPSQPQRLLCVEVDNEYRHNLTASGLQAVKSLANQSNESFDFAYSLNVLEHIEDDMVTLQELNRVLCPNGRLFLYLPAFPVLYSAMDHRVGHVRRYCKQELIEKLQQTGFSIKTIHYVDSLGFFATILFKYFGSRHGLINSATVKRYDKYIFPLSLILDKLLHKVLGKNILVLAEKTPTTPC